jgi:hypothetical protein
MSVSVPSRPSRLSGLRSFYGAHVPRWVKECIHPLLHPRLAFVESYSRYKCHSRVQMGPSKGLYFGASYLDKDVALAALLGTYEIELHPIFEKLRLRGFRRLVDVGAAEGFYAVGLLRHWPGLEVVGFEMNAVQRDRALTLARENGVAERFVLKGFCDAAALREFGDGLSQSLLIVDVEGYEKELLDPSLVPALRHTTMLVEVHDCFVPGCTEAIKQRFSGTHHITEVSMARREPKDYPFEGWVKRSAAMALALSTVMADGRTEVNGWLFLEPKSQAS